MIGLTKCLLTDGSVCRWSGCMTIAGTWVHNVYLYAPFSRKEHKGEDNKMYGWKNLWLTCCWLTFGRVDNNPYTFSVYAPSSREKHEGEHSKTEEVWGHRCDMETEGESDHKY